MTKTASYKITAPHQEWEINIGNVMNDISFYRYNETLFRIELKPETLHRLTEELFKPRFITCDTQRILQAINGMVVRSINVKDSGYIFVGYLKTPNYFIRTFFNNRMLVSKSFSHDPKETKPETPADEFEEIDYSVPFTERKESERNYRKQCFRAYLEGVGNFVSRSRGEYYCIFTEGSKLMAVSKTNLYDLRTGQELDLYTREALLFIFCASGINFDKFGREEYILNHTGSSYILACVRNKTNIFHNPYSDALFDVEYISSSTSSPFYLTAYKSATCKKNDNILFFKTGGSSDANEEERTVPCPNPLWMKHYIGFSKNFGIEPIRTYRDQNDSQTAFFNREYSSLQVYLSDLMTDVVYCSERDYLIDMLTLLSSSIISLADTIKSFWNNKFVIVNQYKVEWPERYTSILDLVNSLFGSLANRSELMYLLGEKEAKPSNEVMRGFIRKLHGNRTLVRMVEEQVEQQISQGEYQYTSSNGRTGRIHLSQYENYIIRKKCFSTLSRTIQGKSCLIKFACDFDDSNVLKVIPSTMSVFISSTSDKIVKFIYSLVVQRVKDGMLNLQEAYKNTKIVDPSLEYAKDISNKRTTVDDDDKEMMETLKNLERIISFDRTSPIYRVRIPNALLEKIILYVEYHKSVEISLSEIEEYSDLLNKKSEDFVCSVASSHGITTEVDEIADSVIIRSSLIEEVNGITIPNSFKLTPNSVKADVMKPIEEFGETNVRKYSGCITKSRMYTLFTQCGLDYHFYQMLNSDS